MVSEAVSDLNSQSDFPVAGKPCEPQMCVPPWIQKEDFSSLFSFLWENGCCFLVWYSIDRYRYFMWTLEHFREIAFPECQVFMQCVTALLQECRGRRTMLAPFLLVLALGCSVIDILELLYFMAPVNVNLLIWKPSEMPFKRDLCFPPPYFK